VIRVRVQLDEAATADLRQRAWEGLARAVVHLHTRLLERLNVPNTGTRGRRGGTVYRNPSRPGEPPRKITGWLQRNVVYELDVGGLKARVGLAANATYGAYLELGTHRVRPRPWLLSTLEQERPYMAALASPKGGA